MAFPRVAILVIVPHRHMMNRAEVLPMRRGCLLGKARQHDLEARDQPVFRGVAQRDLDLSAANLEPHIGTRRGFG